jgi:hypothetical protein
LKSASDFNDESLKHIALLGEKHISSLGKDIDLIRKTTRK